MPIGFNGIPKLYSDYRNKRSNVTFARLWVRDSVRGETQAILDKHLEGMRKATMNPDYDKIN